MAPATRATADTVYLQSGSGKPVALEGVKVKGAEGQNLTFTTAAGVTNTKPLDHVPQIRLQDEPIFSAAEEEFAKSDWATAADKYRSVIAGSSPDWVKLRSMTRLADAGAKSGKSEDSIAAFIALAKMWPAGAADRQPKVESIPSPELDSAIATVRQAAADPKLGKDQKTLLLKYLLTLYASATQRAGHELTELNPPPPPAEPRRPAAVPAVPVTTNEPPGTEYEKALDSARKLRDAKTAEASEEFRLAAVKAFDRFTERRKSAFHIAVETYDIRIKEITKTGDLDRALALRGEKERYIVAAAREDEQLAKEREALDQATSTGTATRPTQDGQPGTLFSGKWVVHFNAGFWGKNLVRMYLVDDMGSVVMTEHNSSSFPAKMKIVNGVGYCTFDRASDANLLPEATRFTLIGQRLLVEVFGPPDEFKDIPGQTGVGLKQ